MATYKNDTKFKKLRKILSGYERIVVAFSGGVDSSFLLAAAAEILNGEVIAVTADSEIRSRRDLIASRDLAKKLGVRHIVIKTNELKNKHVSDNHPARCYHCKKSVFLKLMDIADKHKISTICEGSNTDDGKMYRPGEKAVKELGIKSPLREAGFNKAAIRTLSKKMGLKAHNKPSMSCYLTRFPYGTVIDKVKLIKLKEAEKYLEGLLTCQIRVRIHGDTVRIEIPPETMPRMISSAVRRKIVHKLRSLGYHYITLDLEGYRTGSMDIRL